MIEFSKNGTQETAVAVNGQGTCVVTHFISNGPEHLSGVVLNLHEGSAEAFNSAHRTYKKDIALRGKSVNIVFTEKDQLDFYIGVLERMRGDLEMLKAHTDWTTLSRWSRKNGRCMHRVKTVICGRTATNNSPDNQPTCQKHHQRLVRLDWKGRLRGA